MPSILFVCLGNICRSPAAQGVFEHMLGEKKYPFQVQVGSCGLGDWHEGHLPDERMRHTAEARGVVLSSRAKSFEPRFFEEFDYILPVDKKVMYQLHLFAKTPEDRAKIHLLTRFSKVYKDQDIPDPYYCGQIHFETAMDMIEDACVGLLEHLQEQRL
jgi:protein-tyrosine phosphatase